MPVVGEDPGRGLSPISGPVIPVVLCLDVEPDGTGDAPVPGGPWAGTVAVHRWLADVRAEVEDRTSAAAQFSWFLRMDGQVEDVFGSATHAVDAHPEVVADIDAHGDAVGLHVHAWRRTEQGWLDDYADPAWFGSCIDRSFVAFTEAFGHACRLTRLGTRYLDRPAVERLAAHAVTIDLTAEPGQVDRPDGSMAHVRGGLPDYRRTPRRPHELAPGLLELPLTAGRKQLGFHPYAHLSRMRRHGVGERLDAPLPFGQRVHGSQPFGEHVRASLAAQRRPYLAFAIRSDGIVDDVVGPRLRTHMDDLLALPESPRFRFLTPQDAVALLTR